METERILIVVRGLQGQVGAMGLPRLYDLVLTNERIAGIARDTRAVAALPDPVGVIEEMVTRPNGLQVGRIRVPLGVVALITPWNFPVAIRRGRWRRCRPSATRWSSNRPR